MSTQSGEGHRIVEEVGGDGEVGERYGVNEDVGGDAEVGEEHGLVEDVGDVGGVADLQNTGNQHVVAPNLKRRKYGPSQRNTKLRLKRKLMTKADKGESLGNHLTI
uniref:Uncharacterized protein n=1 Tax=Lactuca sativa TaxID=4236 RepID=A0A9R1UYK7_LACSA|nr:hypothetical protein LSAT_V11C700354120 [Lactuca sativa]